MKCTYSAITRARGVLVGARRDSRGNALVVTLLITLALSGLVMGALVASQTEMRLSSNTSMQQKAFYLAERGMEESIAFLAQMGQPLVGSGADGGGPVVLFTDIDTGEGRYTVWADPMDNNSGRASRFVALTVRGTLDGSGVSRAMQIRLGQQNFSRYAYFTDIETSASGGTIWFTGNDEFFGPVHTNDQMHIAGDPIFHEEASSGAADLDYYNGGPPQDDPVFEMGLNLNADNILLPPNTDLLRAKGLAADGLDFTGTAVIEMRLDAGGNGILRVRVNGGAAVDYPLPANGVCFVDGKVELKGTLKGQLTIACEGDIEIMDNCVYDTDPRIDPTSTDMLGIVADGDVYMDGYAYGANVDTADETVMAAIMTLDESFTVENYNSGSPRGNLVIYGGLIQYRRGPVGTFNGSTGQIITGYAKDYSYDPRLMDNPPPAFPTTGDIDKISWQEIDPSQDITANYW